MIRNPLSFSKKHVFTISFVKASCQSISLKKIVKNSNPSLLYYRYYEARTNKQGSPEQ